MARQVKDFDHYLILGLCTVIILATFLFVFSSQVKTPTPPASASAASYCDPEQQGWQRCAGGDRYVETCKNGVWKRTRDCWEVKGTCDRLPNHRAGCAKG